jgi:uncharacterized protein (TIGR02757 family)
MNNLMHQNQLAELLNRKVLEYNNPTFIANDPISIPHQFSLKQDIEIAAFFVATLAWGNRTSIINSANKIMQAMHFAPHDFILNHQAQDLKFFMDIKHRTFNTTDLLYFIHFLTFHYATNESLESAFAKSNTTDIKARLIAFHNYFFSVEYPERTRKHVSTPIRNSACKRLNMFLRWMVRADNQGVDFGIWHSIKMSELICPLDIHVARVSNRLLLIPNQKANWQNAEILTNVLKSFDKNDPCKYDFALFSLGAEERIK